VSARLRDIIGGLLVLYTQGKAAMKNVRNRSWMLALLIAMPLLFALPGCEKEQGPMEEAGENIDEAVQDAKRAVEDATD
jgi:hypothetical protein